MNLITIPAGKIERGQLVFEDDGETVKRGYLTGNCRMESGLELEVNWHGTDAEPTPYTEFVAATFVQVKED